MNATAKRIVARGCRGLGIDRIIRRSTPGRFVILMFHRVVSAATLETSANTPLMVAEGIFHDMAETLARRSHCLPLRQALALARTGAVYSKPVVAITFDDGYGDFGETVFPILKRFGLPATMFLPTGFLDDPDRFFWWDAVEASLAAPRGLERFADAALPEAFLRELSAVAANPSPGKTAAFIRGPLYRLDPVERAQFVGMLPVRADRRPAMLSWDHVRDMAGSGLVDFAAHGVTHALLDELESAPALEEVVASKQRIEEETGRPVTSFAYPAGRIPSYYKEMLDQARIGLAVTTRFGGNDARSNPLLLRRVDARFCQTGDTFDPLFFMAVCSGCFDWLHGLREARHGVVN